MQSFEQNLVCCCCCCCCLSCVVVPLSNNACRSGTEELTLPHFVEETTKSGERVRRKAKRSLRDIIAEYTSVGESGLALQRLVCAMADCDAWHLQCAKQIPFKCLSKVKDEHSVKITKELCSFHKSQVDISVAVDGWRC